MTRHTPRTRAPRQRGFTLVELLIAMAAGLVVSLAAFLLSKNATRFFQNEARASASHLAATLGLNRLTADLQRAASLSSPNVLRDPFVCGSPDTWPDGMRALAGITIQQRGSVTRHPTELGQSIVNSLHPDSIVIGGSLDTTEQFEFSSITSEAGSWVVHLNPRSAAVQRTLDRGGGDVTALTGLFRPNRILRIKIRGQDKYMYGAIESTSVVGAPVAGVSIHLMATPGLPLKGMYGPCGVTLDGFAGSAGVVSVISRVRYDIRSLLSNATYGPLVAPIAPALTGDNGRTELVRVELDENDQELPETLELVAEYAVDLKFGISAAPALTDPLTITRYPLISPAENTNVYAIAGANDQPGALPHRVRTVQVRLSTRTRAPDRDAGFPVGPDGRRLRFFIPGIVPGVNTPTATVPQNAPPVFARMRTLYVDVALPNQAYVTW